MFLLYFYSLFPLAGSSFQILPGIRRSSDQRSLHCCRVERVNPESRPLQPNHQAFGAEVHPLPSSGLPLLRRRRGLVLPVHSVACLAAFGLALPLAISLFPQMSQCESAGAGDRRGNGL